MGDEQNEVFEGDLSPITILLIGCFVSAVVFSVMKRIVDGAAARQKFRRRSREEEEALLARQAPALVEGPQIPDREEEKQAELEEVLDDDENNIGADDDVVEEEQTQDNGPRLMNKRELQKAEKKKKKQEQQEAWRHMLEHERRLRELRETEDQEREAFERQQEDERRKKKSTTKSEMRNPSPSDEEVLAFFAYHPSKLIMRNDVITRFPNSDRQKLFEQVERVLTRSHQTVIIPVNEGDFLRVDADGIAKLRDRIRLKGSLPLADLLEELRLCTL